MVPRKLAESLRSLARLYPVVTVTGPRQSGKTTLCRATFDDRAYVSLEPLDVREYARTDPRGFLAEIREGALIDEVQHVPELLSYLQVEVDERPTPGRFILTGSQHFGLSQGISQSLAGRTGVLHLLPLGQDELARFPKAPSELLPTLWQGGYPRIHDQEIPADRWHADYVSTYIQQDVRQVLNVGDLTTFTTFLRMCAGRTAQELNLSALGGDVGVSHNTARAWLSVLETSFLCFRAGAWHRNVKKQLVKAPKLHFFDSGLLCYLLGIRSPEQLRHHPLRGAIFESWVVSEVYKARVHRGNAAALGHFREARGLEVDLIVEAADKLIATEIKAGATVASELLRPLERFRTLAESAGEWRPIDTRLVYGGDTPAHRSAGTVMPWHQVAAADWGI